MDAKQRSAPEWKGIFLPLLTSLGLFLVVASVFASYLDGWLRHDSLIYDLLSSEWIQYGIALAVSLVLFRIVRLPLSKKGILAFWWPLLAMSLAGTAIGVIILLLSEVNPAIDRAMEGGSPAVLLTLNVLVYVLALTVISAPVYRYFFGREHSKLHIFGLQQRPKARHLLVLVLAFGAYFLTTATAITLAKLFLPFVDVDQPQELGLQAPEAVMQYVVIFLMLVVAAPIAEELLFRGFMFKALRDRLSFWPTAILVSVLFGIAHGQWNVGIDTFVLSLFLCALREYTGSLWMSILLHALKNFLAFSLLFLFPDLIPALQ